MPVNPRFLAARANERRHRDLTHIRALCWLPLHRKGVLLTRAPVVPFTRRHRLELRAAANALFCAGGPVLLGDVFVFLWRLHPLYRAPRLGYEGKAGGLLFMWRALGSLRSAATYCRLARLVRQSDLSAAVSGIDQFLDVANQDAPGEDADATGRPKRRSLAAPDRQASDNSVDWLMTAYSISHDEALDFPIALAHQLYRERQFAEPDADVRICAPSDTLLGQA